MALTTDSKQISHVTSMTLTRMVESKQMIFIFIFTIVASPVLATELEVVFIIRIMQWPCGHCSYNTLLLISDHGSFPMTIFRPSPCLSVTLPWRRSVSLTSMVGGHWSAIIQHDYNDQNYHSWWLWRILLFSIPRGLQWVHNNYWLLQVNVWLIDCPDCPLIVQMSSWSTRSKNNAI